jgi:hypothetical protein
MGLSSPLRKALRLLMDIWIFRKGIYLWEQAWTSTLIHFSGIIAYAFLAQGLHIPVSFLDLVLLVPLISLISLIPISIAGWGLREMGAVWLFGLVGLSRADALALSITYGLSLMLSGIPGLYLFLKGRIQGFSATGIE